MATKVSCSNCLNEAQYTLSDPGWSAVNYCPSCLPAHLWDRANQGQLVLVVPTEAPTETEPSEGN
jgi:hypothetical protein